MLPVAGEQPGGRPQFPAARGHVPVEATGRDVDGVFHHPDMRFRMAWPSDW